MMSRVGSGRVGSSRWVVGLGMGRKMGGVGKGGYADGREGGGG
jgi:hypothetical protein